MWQAFIARRHLPYHYEQVESVPTILIDQDQSSSSRSLQRLLIASPNIKVRAISNHPNSIQAALWQGDAMASLHPLQLHTRPLYFFLGALRIQNYAQAEHWSHLFLFALLFSFCIAAFSMLIGRLFKTRERGLQLLLVTAVPMLFVSGYSWPTEALPELLTYLRWLLPSTAGIHGFVSINQLGASLYDITTEVTALLALTFTLMALGLWFYRHKS